MPRLFSLLPVFSLLLAATAVVACDHCGCDETPVQGGFGTILAPAAGTLPRGAVAISLNGEFVKYESWDPVAAANLVASGVDTHDRTRDRRENLSVGVGATENLTLTATVSHVAKQDFEIADPDRIGRRQTASGFGDAELAAKYRFHRGVWSWAALGRVKFATGRTNVRTPGGERYETELQPGSGSTDYSAGLAATRHFSMRTTFNAGISYTRHGDGGTDEQRYRFGDLYQATAGFAHAFSTPDAPHLIAGTLELSALHSDRDRADGETDPNSGTKFALFIAPGLSLRLHPAATAFLAIPVAVSDHPNGVHQKTRFEVLTGVTFRF